MTGLTYSANFPTTAGAFQTTLGGLNNAFVTELNPTGSALVYSTYLGGNGSDDGYAIALDPSGDAYVTGYTTANFPTTAGALQTTLTGGGFNAFISKLSFPTPTATSTGATPTATPTATKTATATATPTPVASVPASLAFGSEPVGDNVTKTITVRNTGHAPLVISSVIPSDPEYALSGTGTCGAIPVTVAADASCTLGVAFTPNAVGAHGATLTVSDNTRTSPQHVSLSGTGTIDMTVTPASYAFGSVRDASRTTKSITVHNYQPSSVSLSESFSGPNSGDFSITGGSCTSTLSAKTACMLIVSFVPTALGAESATMKVTDSPDTLGPYTVSFGGTGVTPLKVTPACIAFGTIPSGHSSPTKTVTVTNSGTVMLTISKSVTVITGNSGDFAVTGGTCGATLAGGGAHCTYQLKFTPSILGAVSATLRITAVGDSSSPHNVSLTGTGS